MRNGLLVLAVLAGLLLVTPAASAAKRPIVGIGDQKTQMFDDARLSWLGVKHARLVIPWYVGTGVNPEELAYVDRWMEAARRTGVQPLVGFGHGFVGWTRIYLPKPREFKAAVTAFRKRYPWVRNYIAWNEANHCSQPTCKKPRRAAQYYDILERSCPKCTIVAAAVIDQPNMVSWLKRFRRAAHHKPKVYGLHNYLDVNRKRSKGTRALLRAVPKRARVWITETGGLVHRRHYRGQADFPENARHAGKVTRFLMRMARKHRRIKRVYLYHWNADRVEATWDSGLIDPFGVARPGFSALARALGRNPRLAPPPGGPPAPAPSDLPIAQNQPPAPEQPSGGQQSDQPSGGGSQPPEEEQPPTGPQPPALPVDPAQCEQLQQFCDRLTGGLNLGLR